MRKIHVVALAVTGLALAAGSLGLGVAADPPAPQLSPRAFVPAIAGDDSVYSPGPTATPIPTGCAGPRTPVKILADAEAGFDRTPQATTVGLLLIGQRPAGITNATPRIDPAEARVVEVTATLLGFQRANGGGIDLAIAMTPGGEAMIASLPGPACTQESSDEDRAAMNAARIMVQQACGNPPDSGIFKPLGGKAKLTGVPFWGKQHTSTLGAPSGIELGPVLSFAFDPATSCDSEASKTPYPTATPTPVVQEMLVGVDPTSASPGDAVTVFVQSVPAVAGKVCGYEIWSPLPLTELIASGGPAATGPDGIASWQVTLPSPLAPGMYRVQPKCPGLPTDGSARLTIVAP